jgi:hypothetical protein
MNIPEVFRQNPKNFESFTAKAAVSTVINVWRLFLNKKFHLLNKKYLAKCKQTTREILLKMQKLKKKKKPFKVLMSF